MAIINILCETLILLVCNIIQGFGVLFEGFAKLFGKCGEYLEKLHDKLIKVCNDQKKVKRNAFDLPL